MQAMIQWLESAYGSVPLPLLELWGRFACLVGLALACCAYGRMSLRRGGAWGLSRERQRWDGRAFVNAGLSFVLVPVAGWIGSAVVPVEGAQTLEPLKDVMVFVCVVLFGYPALVAMAPASMLSDLIEGVPPSFVWDGFGGYFLSVGFVWVACQLIGSDPDFRRLRTWGLYALFVAQRIFFDPAMWGFIRSAQFGGGISYGVISPALAFTLLVSSALAPFAMLCALPLARRLGLFWAEIPGHVRHRSLGGGHVWVSGRSGRGGSGQDGPGGQGGPGGPHDPAADALDGLQPAGVPLRMALAGGLIAAVLAVSGAVAFFALRSGAEGASKLALRLHQEVADTIDIRLDSYLDADQRPQAERMQGVSALLAGLSIAKDGRALLLDRRGRVVAASTAAPAATDPAIAAALATLREQAPVLAALRQPLDFRFVVLSAQPLSRETWLARATPYTDRPGHIDWLALTAVPERFYLAEINAGSRRTALLCALALCIAMASASLLAALVAAPAQRIIAAAQAMARGELGQHVAGSRLAEMGALVAAFNRMSGQMQDALRGSQRTEETLKGIFGASPVAMAVFRVEPGGAGAGERPQGELTFVDINAAWERTTGYARAATIGQPGAALHLWVDMDVRRRFIAAMREQGTVRRLQTRMLRADGRSYPAEVSGQDVRVGSERFHVVAIDDFTAQEEASAQLQALNRQLGALLDAAIEVAIVATDAHSRITVFNRGAERMLGYTAAEMIGEPVQRLHLADDIAVHAHELAPRGSEVPGPAAFYREQTAQSGAARNWILVRKDGQPVQVSMALSTVRDPQGAVSGYLGIARDITEQLAAQASLVELNTELDQRVRERTQALETSRARLEQTMAQLQQMQGKLVQSEKLAGLGHIVAAVAHELNTPIGNCVTVASTLLGDTQALSREVAAGSLRKQRFGEYLAGMQSGTELLQRALQQAARLVDNFKRVAEDAGGSERRLFDLAEAVDDAVALLQPMLRRTAYRLDVAVPAGIAMDSHPGALEQVLTNLVNNAVLHGFAGREQGRMALRAERDGAVVRLHFSDDGKGMSADTLARIYDPFFTTALGRGGSGLGMNISYKLVTGQLGGEIDVRSAPGEGSHFTLTLPLVAPAAAGAESPAT